MNLSDYTYLLNHPESINGKRTEELDKIVTEFPYLQSARAMRLKGLYNEDSFRYNYALKVTAAFTTDRSVLFDFITSAHFTSVDKATYAQKQRQVHEIEVSGVSEMAEKPEMPELTMDDSFRASLDTEFVPAEEVKQDHHVPQSEIVASENNNPEAEIDSATSETLTEDVAPQEFVDYDNHEDEVVSDDEIAGSDEFEADIENQNAEADDSETLKTTGEQNYDAATRSVLDSIKEAEQYAKSLVVADAEEIIADPAPPSKIESEPVEIADASEDKLDIGKPLDFSASETHSFHEWLQLSKFTPIEREPVRNDSVLSEKEQEFAVEEEDAERQKKKELIDKFIESNPKIPKITPEAKSSSFIFEPSQADNSYLMTETLARVYLEQKKYEKAIQAYEILILKYPEKNSFFADRILDIRNLQQNNKLQ